MSNSLDVANNHFNLSEQYDESCYNMLIMKTNLLFASADTEGALKAFKKCHGFNDSVERYNKAFLRFWRGEFNHARKQYDAFKKSNYKTDFTITLSNGK